MNYQKLKLNVADIRYMGAEPKAPLEFKSSNDVLKFYNWYNYFYDPTIWKSWVVAYNKSIGDKYTLGRVPEKLFINSLGVNAKLIMDGVRLPADVMERFNNKLEELSSHNKKINDEPVQEVVSVRKRVVENANSLIADIEDVLDLFYNSNYKSDFKLYEYLSKRQISRPQAKMLYDYYLPVFEDVKNNPGDYTRTKTQYKSYLSFLKMLVDDSFKYVENKTTTRKPRKKKAVKVEDSVKNVSFKKDNVELKLVSIKPEQIVGAQMVVLYNDKYRYVTILCASGSNTLQIKGTTIYNFDPEKSFTKSVRKPETLNTLISGTQKAILKNIGGLSTKEKAGVSGRINSETLLLKAFK